VASGGRAVAGVNGATWAAVNASAPVTFTTGDLRGYGRGPGRIGDPIG
jgi:hypothetical protein